jgi:hypothetical protein
MSHQRRVARTIVDREDHCRWQPHQGRIIVDGTGDHCCWQRGPWSRTKTKWHRFPYTTFQELNLWAKSDREWRRNQKQSIVVYTSLLQSHEFWQPQGLSITHWIHGDIWWDPFQFLFSGQTGFYNGNFSPQEQVLACKRTNATTKLKTAETPGIQEAGLQKLLGIKRQAWRGLWFIPYLNSHKFNLRKSKSCALFVCCPLCAIYERIDNGPVPSSTLCWLTQSSILLDAGFSTVAVVAATTSPVDCWPRRTCAVNNGPLCAIDNGPLFHRRCEYIIS